VADDVAKLPQLPPSNYDIAASVESAEREYTATNLDEAIAKNVLAIKPMVEAHFLNFPTPTGSVTTTMRR
jgi:hypothetical protein